MQKMKLATALALLATGWAAPAVSAGSGARPVKFGCAYYPEAWPRENWAKDIAAMKELGLSMIRIGEFNWGNFEPEEGRFDFSDYVELLNICETNGIDVMMCTPTATLPLWMHRKYPECEKSRRDGWRPGLGSRQSRCPSSQRFRFFSKRIAEKMAEAFRGFSCIKWWQIDNELHIVAGTGLCECPECERGFRKWLMARYGTIDALNKAWNSAFWSSRFGSWEDVQLPIQPGREPWMTEYVRYQSDVYLDFAREQRDAIRRFSPGAVVTSNGSEMSGWLRLDTLYRDLGYAATDTYVNDAFYDRARWMWGLSRGLTGRQRPFMIAEIGAYTKDVEKKNADDIVDVWIDDAVKHGAECITFFRWRQSVNGEQAHPAILPWSGRKGRVYERVKRIVGKGYSVSMPRGDVAILHSNESDQDMLVRSGDIQFGYYETPSILLNAALERRGVLPDYLISGPDVDFSAYRTVFIPVNTIVPKEVAAKLKDFVRAGGTAVAVARLNLIDPRGGSYYTEPYPVGMTDLFGIEITEQRARLDRKYAYDRVELKGAVAARRFTTGVFAGEPEISLMEFGKGRAWYVASLPLTEEKIERILDATIGPGEKAVAALRKTAEAAMAEPKIDVAPAARYRIANLRYCMNSGFAMTPKGRIWTSWVGGEDGPRAFLVQHHSDDGGKTWSDTDFVVDPHVRERKPDFILSITSNFWCDPQGRMHFFFDQSMGTTGSDPRGYTHMDGRAGVWETVSENPDDPRPTWSRPRRIGDGHALSKPIVAKDGTWYLPVCLNAASAGSAWFWAFPELDERRGVNVYASTDSGKTWVLRGNCRFPRIDWHEPQMVELSDGRLWLLVRSNHQDCDRGMMQSFSRDGGRTWNAPDYPQLNNPIARFVCQKLKGGNILLVCHGRPESWQGERNELTAWLSRDDGRTWEGGLLLDGRNRVSYPDAFQAADGSVWIQWDHLRTNGEILFARVTEADILAGKATSQGSVVGGTVVDFRGK